MEVVLSPGRFGDEASSGGPFQNEEIREWSHVDRLTGMLERARVETGRWQTSNQGAARSYGKVIDSRERNSADGSVVQRARRQVEVFQSQAPGRSVQVVRASQWSSSRVTDSIISGPLALSPVPQSKSQEEDTPSEGIGVLNRLTSRPSSLRRDEAISERLSSLLGSFAYSASSTVPLRRIDSKYSTRTPISLTASKRFSSNENVSAIGESRLDVASTTRTPRETSTAVHRGPLEVLPTVGKEDFARERADDNRGSEQVANVRVRPDDDPDKHHREAKISVREKKNSFDETARPAASRAKAIHLLPSSKANTTVVNLINTSNEQQPTWISSSSQLASDTALVCTETKPTLGGESPRAKIDEAAMATSGRTKRVGFCKTEIHFAADSGKVNIVETDGKPPPTNKFRRRRRNSLCNKAVPVVSKEAIDYACEAPKKDGVPIDEPIDDPTKNDPNLHRGHTTTVNLGADLNAKNQRAERVTEESSEILESLDSEKTIGSSSLPAPAPAGSSSKPEARQPSNDGYDVLCTDADNNKVLLKVVTTHEPTIARVESDHRLRRKTTVGNGLPAVGKKELRTTNPKQSKTDASSREHTYVNVFTGSKRAPIYENYKISEVESKDVNSTCETKTVPEKIVHDSKGQNFVPVKKSVDSDNPKVDKIKTVAETKIVASVDADDVSTVGKKVRSKTKDVKLPVKVKSARPEVSASNSTTSGAARVRSSRNGSPKVAASKRSSTRAPEESVLPTERVSRTSGGSSNGCRTNGSKATRDVVASVKAIKKNDGTTSKKPMEVVYQTAVYNMKNERLSRPQKGKTSKGPRYLNELICGAKTKRASESKNKTSSAQNAADKGALQTIRHWK